MFGNKDKKDHTFSFVILERIHQERVVFNSHLEENERQRTLAAVGMEWNGGWGREEEEYGEAVGLWGEKSVSHMRCGWW